MLCSLHSTCYYFLVLVVNSDRFQILEIARSNAGSPFLCTLYCIRQFIWGTAKSKQSSRVILKKYINNLAGIMFIFSTHLCFWGNKRIFPISYVVYSVNYLVCLLTAARTNQVGEWLPYTRVNKRNWLRSAYCLLSAYFFPGFAPG